MYTRSDPGDGSALKVQTATTITTNGIQKLKERRNSLQKKYEEIKNLSRLKGTGDSGSQQNDSRDDHDSGEQEHVSKEKLIPTSSTAVTVIKDARVEDTYKGQVTAPPSDHRHSAESQIFIQAIMQLLENSQGIELAKQYHRTNAGHSCSLLAGYIRKATPSRKGEWKTKYAEIRAGVFLYSDCIDIGDTFVKGTEKRKTIWLSTSFKCRPVKVAEHIMRILSDAGEKADEGCFFETSTEGGGSSRLWMTRTRLERDAWLSALCNATVDKYSIRDGNLDSTNFYMETSPYAEDIRRYRHAQTLFRKAFNKQEYLSSLSILHGVEWCVPVNWVREQVVHQSKEIYSNLPVSTEQLWKDLVRDSLTLNGKYFKGEGNIMGPMTMFSELTRMILTFDSFANCHGYSGGNYSSNKKLSRITESQAVIFARSIFLSCSRTRNGGDSYLCLSELFSNPNLVTLIPSSLDGEPINVSIRSVAQHCKCGWIWVRTSGDSTGEKTFCVLSGGELLLFPDEFVDYQRLKGRLTLSKFSTKVATYLSEKNKSIHVLKLSSPSEKKYLMFRDEEDLLLWQQAFKRVCCNIVDNNRAISGETEVKSSIEVVVEVTTWYKICTIDPRGHNSRDTWGTIGSTFRQTFLLSGGQDGCIVENDEIVKIHGIL